MKIFDVLATPQLTRTNPAHVGSAPLTNPNEKVQSRAERKMGTFESYLTNAVSTMNSQQLEVGRVEQQLLTDPDSVDVHDVVTAMAKAQMSLSLAQTVIDRLVSGWSEISTTR